MSLLLQTTESVLLLLLRAGWEGELGRDWGRREGGRGQEGDGEPGEVGGEGKWDGFLLGGGGGGGELALSRRFDSVQLLVELALWFGRG